jgi:hypothetical protein
MPGMKLLSGLPLDQIGHSPGRPQPGAVTQHLGAFFQPAPQLFQLGRQQPRLATGPTCLMQRTGSCFAPSLMPSTDRLPMNPQLSGDLALTQTPLEKSGSLESSPFQIIKVAFNAFWVTHAQKIARKPERVTILCDIQ